MRRRIFWGLAAMTAALALVAGMGTFGFFSDTRVNPGNRFQAGTLVLGNNRDGLFILSASNMQPGDSLTRSVTLTRDPASTLDMNYFLSRTDISPSATSGLCPELEIAVTRADAGQAADDGAPIAAGAISAAGDTVGTFAVVEIPLGSLNNSGNSSDTYNFQVTFDPNAGNAFQGTACEVTYTWRAAQQTSNEDLSTLP